MADKILVFDHIYYDKTDKLEQKFNEFFPKYNLMALFGEEHRTSQKKVRIVDAESIVNTGGSYHKTFKQFANIITKNNNVQRYDDALLKMLDTAETFQKYANNVKKVYEYIQQIDEKYKYNMWNAVFYDEDLLK